jgi:hypothetical protein
MKNLLLTLAFIIALGSHVEAATGADNYSLFTTEEIIAYYKTFLRREYNDRYPGGGHEIISQSGTDTIDRSDTCLLYTSPSPRDH